MIAVIQRINSASVIADGGQAGRAENGLFILLGVKAGDTAEISRRMADKIAKMRIFEDENERINLSLSQVGGSMLVVSQFTLYANCTHGNRPEFFSSAAPDKAERLYEYFVNYARSLVPDVQTGQFGADMKVSIENDGPFTIYLDTEAMK